MAAAASPLDDLAEMAKLPLVVGIDVDQQDVHALERRDGLAVDALQIADAVSTRTSSIAAHMGLILSRTRPTW